MFETPRRPIRLALPFVFASLAISLATATSADVTTTPQAASPLTPEKIYLRAIHAMREMPEPAYVTFRETIVGRNFTLRCTNDGASISLHHGDITAAYDVAFRTSDSSAVSRPVGVVSPSPCPFALLAPAGSAISSLGLPQPSPSPSASAVPQTAPPAVGDTNIGPPIIAALHVEGARYYHIDLVGREQLGTSDVYHLKLRAYREPNTHPLTDLYIDPETFLVREARADVATRFVIGSGRFAGILDFARVGTYWLVERERFDIAGNALFVHARMTATIEGSDFATPSELPGIIFPTPRPTGRS